MTELSRSRERDPMIDRRVSGDGALFLNLESARGNNRINAIITPAGLIREKQRELSGGYAEGRG